MSTHDSFPSIAITPEQAQAMPEAERTTARALYAEHYDPAEVERVFGAAAAPVQNNTASVRALAGPASATSFSHVPADQKIAALKNARALGVPLEDVRRAAEGEGISWDQVTEDAAPDLAAVATQQREAELDSTYAAPADANGYQLQYGNIAQTSDIAELAALNGEVSTAFAAASVPSTLAQPLLDAILETGELYASESMTDAGRELRFREEGALFKKISPNPAEDLRLATLAYNALPKSFRDQLDANHALHSARAQLQLAAVGRAIEYRAAKSKR